VLTSSPVDFNHVQAASIALGGTITYSDPVSAPMGGCVAFLTKNVERLQAANTIIQHESEQLKARIHQRKRQLSSKRRVIDGKHIITAAELIGIQEVEKVTRARKEKQRDKAP